MVLNDYFDRSRTPANVRRGRFPRAASRRQAARRLGLACLLVGGAGLRLGGDVVAGDPRPGVVATLLAAAVVLYDGVLKQTPLGAGR